MVFIKISLFLILIEIIVKFVYSAGPNDCLSLSSPSECISNKYCKWISTQPLCWILECKERDESICNYDCVWNASVNQCYDFIPCNLRNPDKFACLALNTCLWNDTTMICSPNCSGLDITLCEYYSSECTMSGGSCISITPS